MKKNANAIHPVDEFTDTNAVIPYWQENKNLSVLLSNFLIATH